MTRRFLVYATLFLAAVGLTVRAWWLKPIQPLRTSVVSAAVPVHTIGFARAEGPTPLRFPADHGPHDDYQTEWWYYTGNLTADTGEHFGYQFTIFRRALIPPAERIKRASAWATEQVYMAHFALTDVAGNSHDAFERLTRGAAGLAGAQASPYRVWLEDWSVGAMPDGSIRLRAHAGEIALDLSLSDLKGPTLQGDNGFSRKGPQPGNASYYYSMTRIATAGSVTTRGKAFEVTGLSWMDHEYSTSALGPEVVGWDWFSLQLDNGSELMAYFLRRVDGSVDRFSSGMLIAADGGTRSLGPDGFTLEVTDRWRSPHTDANYPAGWILTVPEADLRLTITPWMADQEMNVSYAYWEGAVRIAGEVAGDAVSGNGYVELTGYADSLNGRL